MLECLSNLLFSEILEHRTINGYRSAISAYHEKGERVTIGQHPQICQLLLGVFNKRPAQPKYTVIWDIFREIDYIGTLCSSEHLSPKTINLKLTTFLVIL